MNRAEDLLGQQPVARHGQEDAGLAQEGNENHAGHASQGARGDQSRGNPDSATNAIVVQRALEGNGDRRIRID